MMRVWALALAAGWTAALSPPDAVALPPAEEEVIALDFSGTTLHEALARIFDGSGVVIEWLDNGAAGQVIMGHYEGLVPEVVAVLLSRTDFVISHDAEGGIARIAIMGRNLTAPDAPPLPAAQTVRVYSKKPAVKVTLTVEQRRQHVREKKLKRIQATNEAVRLRLASLPPGF